MSPLPDSCLKPIAGRNIAAVFNPRPLALIGAQHEHEVDFATLAWITPVSHTPPQVVFALRERSRTFQLLSASRYCSINIPTRALLETVQYCGNHQGARENKAKRIPFAFFKDCLSNLDPDDLSQDIREEQQHTPVIEAASSLLLAHVKTITETGDHQLVYAEIQAAFSREAIDSQGLLHAHETLLCVQHNTFAHHAKLIDE